MKALTISAIGSNEGKTVLTTALLHYFKDSVRPFKIGPDFIDPQFHEHIAHTPSINLDRFMMDDEQVKWLFNRYSDKNISICEGVMGFYDGMDKGSSAYDISKLLAIPTILLLNGSSSYITVSAVLKGLVTYKNDNTIQGVILNKLSSQSHFELIKNQIEKDFDNIVVLGWIKKDITSLSDTHLGLDLKEQYKIEKIANEVLEYIDVQAVEQLASSYIAKNVNNYPFEKLSPINKKIAIVHDANFSFLYHDNVEFLKEVFDEVLFVNPSLDETIAEDVDVVYIPGGYVENEINYDRLKNSQHFKNSLIKHAQTKHIYAECAGMLYLSKCVDEKEMSGILDLEFTLHNRFQRMGYYCSSLDQRKGHAFHYTDVLDPKEGDERLLKSPNSEGKVGSWQKNNVYGTYLHIMLRSNPQIITSRFL
ncbi:cobyrinate a,c-diamide synthase [Sulfurimonas sp. C5]|uniref:cobyrinate a,c-diamide synthase n=1 Tax=Sulfurimonas sp. C5 TaxID=3036947 RepID=UPI002457D3AA|nr:cobyrinate a,c-diamide synthase [Sulfurimonas sp. C5]MDH4944796.1 cobyrinate a,c-diamide synthase [Sulfurimonas sp. C5]